MGMTPAEIAALPDRELDALVAEKVMGWWPHVRNTAHWVAWADRIICGYKVKALVSEWRPSTDPRAMMEVVRAMQNMPGKPWSVSLNFQCKGYAAICEISDIQFREQDYTDYEAGHDNPCRAVAEAALLAVRAQKGGGE